MLVTQFVLLFIMIMNGITAFTTTSKPCVAMEFTCNSGKCIDIDLQCNGNADCESGEDERNCTLIKTRIRTKTRPCMHHEFLCWNQICLNNRYRCNGVPDCTLGEDEFNCRDRRTGTTIPKPYCKSNQFTCSSGRCVPIEFKCDGVSDCDGGEDELYCQMRTTTPTTTTTPKTYCYSYQFTCSSGRCVNNEFKCDGDWDCDGGEDEQDCPVRTTTPTTTTTKVVPCNRDQFACRSGFCIPIKAKCDGVRNCLFGEDELNCTVRGTTTAKTSCNWDQFICRSGRCINAAYKCNGHIDCEFGEDEYRCLRPTIPTKAQSRGETITRGLSSTSIAWIYFTMLVSGTLVIVIILTVCCAQRKKPSPSVALQPIRPTNAGTGVNLLNVATEFPSASAPVSVATVNEQLLYRPGFANPICIDNSEVQVNLNIPRIRSNFNVTTHSSSPVSLHSVSRQLPYNPNFDCTENVEDPPPRYSEVVHANVYPEQGH